MKLVKNLSVVAEWVYERLQIQVAENHRSQVQIPLRTCNYDGEIVTKKRYNTLKTNTVGI